MSLSPNVDDDLCGSPPVVSPNTAPVVLEIDQRPRRISAPAGAVVIMTDDASTRTIVQAKPGEIVQIGGAPTSFKARVPRSRKKNPRTCSGAFSFSDTIDAPAYYPREPTVLIARKVKRGNAANIWQIALGNVKTGVVSCAECQSETCESITNKEGTIKILPNTRWACITKLGKVGARLWDQVPGPRKRRRTSKVDAFVESSRAKAKDGLAIPFHELYSLDANAVRSRLSKLEASRLPP